MRDLNLKDATINLEGEWLSAEDLTNKIQEKMQAGDMKFSNLATALEELNNALENAKTIEIKLILSKEEYKILQAIGGDNDSECIQKAIKAFISSGLAESPAEVKDKKKLVIRCPKCKAPIEITSDERPLEVECSQCGTGGRLTPQNKWVKLS